MDSQHVDKAIRKTDRMTVLKFFCYLSVFTISFDIFLVINLGFNFRFSQLVLLIPFTAVLAHTLLKRRYIWPVGFLPLAVWSMFILAYIPNTHFILRSIGYGIWLIFNLMMIFTFVQIFNRKDSVLQLIKYYIYSFFFVALFGLIQFILPIFSLGAPLVTQWWINGVLARINGFSYEPSFFATYLLTGWVLTAWLLKRGTGIIGKKILYFIFSIETLVMALSSSRMGWIMMIMWFMQYPFLFIFRLARGRFNISYFKGTLMVTSFGLTLTGIVVYYIGATNLKFLIEGLGIAGTTATSSATRITEFTDTLRIFSGSPFWGYSLGGISSALGDLRGIDVSTIEAAKENEGMSVFAEVLAASGIIGFVPFAIYIVMLIAKPILLLSHIADREMKIHLTGMVISLCFVLIILQMNQNILRPYLWLHIAILSSIYAVNTKGTLTS
jgi:hypothetical protein